MCMSGQPAALLIWHVALQCIVDDSSVYKHMSYIFIAMASSCRRCMLVSWRLISNARSVTRRAVLLPLWLSLAAGSCLLPMLVIAVLTWTPVWR